MSEMNSSPEPTAGRMRLLRTKLFLPHPHPDIIDRPRLTEKLQAVLHSKLAVISAPAGSGKSTLVSAWIHQKDERERMEDESRDALHPSSFTLLPSHFAWLSLDERDSDPARFWAYFIAALQTIQPGFGATALSMLQSPAMPPQENLLTEILNDMAALPEAGVLVLDDTHTITDETIHAGLAFLVENLPEQMHLVLAGRHDPPLPLPQYRVRRELVELHAEDLRFTHQEAAAFLKQVMGLDLTPHDIAVLDQLTEGWVAGLQLAALSMQGVEDISSFIASFSGRHRFVFDYLAQEVLDRQPASLQRFLLHTSILERMCASLCAAILDPAASESGGEGGSSSVPVDQSAAEPLSPQACQRILEDLERANLFLVPLDPRREWYRYHHLFADFLQARFEEQAGHTRVAEVHRRASRWLQQEGLVFEAVNHALQAQDYALAIELILQSSEELFLHSELTSLVRWLDLLPPDLVSTNPDLSMMAAWARLAISQPDKVEGHLLDVERSLGSTADGSAQSLSQPPRVLGALAEISCIRASLAFNQFDLPRVLALSQQARRYIEIGGTEGLHNKGDSMRGVVAFNQAVAFEFSGETQAAVEAFEETTAFSQENPHLMPMALSHLGQLRVQQGRLGEAEATYRKALDWIQNSGRPSPLAGMVYTGLGSIQYEWGEFELARHSFEQGIELGRLWNQWESLMTGYLGLSRLAAAQGSLADAHLRLQELAAMASRLMFDMALPAIVGEQALLAARKGDLETASRWVPSAGVPLEGDIPYPLEAQALTLARVENELGHYPQAGKIAGKVLAVARSSRRQGRIIEALIVLAKAAFLEGALDQARPALEEALALAAPERFRQIFLDEGKPVRLLLEQVQMPAGTVRTYRDDLLAAFTPQVVPKAHSGERQPSPEPTPAAPGPVSPLSVRELEVLRLMAEGLTNQAIGDRLFISLNTVKTHVKNILTRLEVANRTQAIARGRELGLL